jgi:hypothetical protein
MAKRLFVSNLSARYPFTLTLLLNFSSFLCNYFQRKFRAKNNPSFTFSAFTSNPFVKRTFSADQSVDRAHRVQTLRLASERSASAIIKMRIACAGDRTR